MPKLILKFDERELQECAVGTHPVTIGRLPDNMVVIDNPAVSGRHARVYREGNHYVLEDLKSTNGTFANDKPIARHTLLEGDVISVGKHTLVFTLKGGEAVETAVPEQFVPEIGGTMMLDTQKQKHLLSGMDHGRPSQVHDAVVPKTAVPTASGRTGTVKVVAGKSDHSEYVLSAVTTMIGKAETSQIRLKGWFKPKVAAAIARKGDGFTITPMGGKLSVNGERLSARRDLVSGDLIEVSGLTLEFTLS
jgi:pSer/pThr/pTyr-binding forkhead associated (FHA) protein